MELKTPEELLSINNDRIKGHLDFTLASIADYLERYYIGEPLTMWIDISKNNALRIDSLLKAELRKKNWRVEITQHQSSQLGGDATEYRISPIVFNGKDYFNK